MKRIYMMIFRNFFRFPVYCLRMVYYAYSKKASEEKKYLFLKSIVKRANIGGNVVIEKYGTENIPKEDGFILFPNHQGMYDVLAVIDTLGHPMSVVIKKELQNIPLLRWVFRVMRAKSMDREDVRQSMKVIMEVTKEVSQGRNYVIFPEGTRSKNGNHVGEFKAGSFKSAVKAKCPIVPVALVDSFKPFDTHTISKVKMKISYLKPLYYDQYKEMNTTQIAELVKEQIVEEISRLGGTADEENVPA